MRQHSSKRAIALFCACILSLVALLSGCASSSSSDTIKIGMLAPLTGVMSPDGEALKLGAEIAKVAINEQGGFAGRPIEVIIEDDKADPAVAAERAKKLIEGDKVDLLIGTISSATTLAILPVVNKNKVPFMYVITGEDKTCMPGDKTKTNPYVFANGYTPNQFWEGASKTLVAKGKTWYFIGNDYIYPRTVNAIGRRMLEKMGVKVVGDDYLPLGSTDFATLIAKIEQAKPEVLFNTLLGSDTAAFVKQAKQFGLFDKTKAIGDAGFTMELYPAMKGAIEGKVVAISRYTPELDNPENKEFVKRYTAKYNTAPVPNAAGGSYSTLMILKAAADKGGSVQSETIRKALEGLKVKLPQGEVEVDAENHIVNMPLYVLEVTTDGTYKVVETLPARRHSGHEDCSVQ